MRYLKSTLRNPNWYIDSYENEDGVEKYVKIFYDIQPAEPDVGIFETSIEITGVFCTDDSVTATVRNRMLGWPPTSVFNKDVTGETEQYHDRFAEEVLRDLNEGFMSEP